MEFNLSDKITEDSEGCCREHLHVPQVKEFINKRDALNADLKEDIIDLIEINYSGKQDLIAKMRRLFKAHQEDKDKLVGDKL